MKPHNVSVIQYFFPETHVTTLNTHDPSKNRLGTQPKISLDIKEVPNIPLRNAVMVTLESDDENSENPPYSFKLVAYGLFEPQFSETEEQIRDYKNNLSPVSLQVLVGASREHLANVTARSPWSTLILNTTNINFNSEGGDNPDNE